MPQSSRHTHPSQCGVDASSLCLTWAMPTKSRSPTPLPYLLMKQEQQRSPLGGSFRKQLALMGRLRNIIILYLKTTKNRQRLEWMVPQSHDHHRATDVHSSPRLPACEKTFTTYTNLPTLRSRVPGPAEVCTGRRR